MRIIFSVILSLFLMFNTIFTSNISLAAELPNAGNFIKAGQTGDDINTKKLMDAFDGSLSDGLTAILKLLYQVGVIVAICVFTYMGIQLLLASPQQKAQLKASMAPFLVGLLLFVAGVPIATLIINLIIQFF